ncbi:MAG: response regulator receiver protein [Geobacteraceae bacterium GWC2_58_44]|nr:MAG: response regulator receiver protein [Geobacteraceae bacterium GWC2_58_44]
MKVLVVDDDQAMVKTLCDILRVKGYGAVSAYSGEEGVEKVCSEGPYCVLMDIRMHGINGIESLKMMKALAPDLPVLLMSAYATGEQAREAKQNGAYTILTKPVDLRLLLSFLSILRKDESIFIVEDDPVCCGSLREILQARGYRVEAEHDAAKVLARMEESCWLLMVLDLKPGSVDKIELLRDIRTRYPSMPVVLVTCDREEMPASIEKGLAIGAYSCIDKPLRTDALIRVVDEIRSKKLLALLGEAS